LDLKEETTLQIDRLKTEKEHSKWNGQRKFEKGGENGVESNEKGASAFEHIPALKWQNIGPNLEEIVPILMDGNKKTQIQEKTNESNGPSKCYQQMKSAGDAILPKCQIKLEGKKLNGNGGKTCLLYWW
jgi:hypothetical protein